MSTIKRITVFLFAALILAANLPLCASAVDPVSASTMANALAQAITAYGASQGVSMTFDVANTDGIGEGVHDLWDQFVTDVNDPNTPTYDSLAVTMWSNLYSKIGNNLGINISATEMPFIDSFWNWILSGPAEMSKVDNQYFEWSINQNDTVDPINVYVDSPFTALPINNQTARYDGKTVCSFMGSYDMKYTSTSNDAVYYFGYPSDNGTGSNTIVFVSAYSFSYKSWDALSPNSNPTGSSSSYSSYYRSIITPPYHANNVYYVPIYTTYQAGEDDFLSFINGSLQSDSISVRPYIGDAAPQNVYIPDNTDVNYNPTDVAIPLDIPWDNTLFGDGDGTLTDAQSEAAASAADDAITDSLEKTLTIADTENPDIPAPGEVYVPFLPVTLPNFNFNLSGIWHYVREWITSLGAWFTTVLTVWASLPYAMVVPVYATLVIVIVLGVYKRFFM